MKKIFAIVALFFFYNNAESATIYMLSKENIANTGKIWEEFRNVTKWEIKSNGVIEFFHNGKFYATSVFRFED